ncbi:F-box protein-like [Forsythia ovata]|uniref:F-box protein-like n=1 Tax=Forsythia ovata TaxID=205694 RepID=A0ABD1WEF8_9LAMI
MQKVFPLGHGEKNVRHYEENEMKNYELPTAGAELGAHDDEDDSTYMIGIPERNGSDELQQQGIITDKIKDATQKILTKYPEWMQDLQKLLCASGRMSNLRLLDQIIFLENCQRGCPKAYHPACIKRDEAFFRSKAKWNCACGHLMIKCTLSSSAHMLQHQHLITAIVEIVWDFESSKFKKQSIELDKSPSGANKLPTSVEEIIPVDNVIVRVDCVIFDDDSALSTTTSSGSVAANKSRNPVFSLFLFVFFGLFKPLQSLTQLITSSPRRQSLSSNSKDLNFDSDHNNVTHHSPTQVLRNFNEIKLLRIELSSGELVIDEGLGFE